MIRCLLAFRLATAATWMLVASVVNAVEPRIEMDARPALAGEQPTPIDEAFTGDVAAAYVFHIAPLPQPGSAELFRTKSTTADAHTSLSFGRTPASLGIDGRVVVPAGLGAIVADLSSAGALHLRSAWRFEDDAEYTVTVLRGPHGTDPMTNRTGSTMSGDRTLVWTAITQGERQRVLIRRAGHSPGGWAVTLERVAHFDHEIFGVTATAVPKRLGDAAHCQMDIACVLDLLSPAEDQIVLGASRGVAFILTTTPSGGTGTCTGTLLNSANYPRPYFLTANHCIRNAATFDTFWFFSRTGCGYGTISPATQISGGASIVWASESLDSALLELRESPPAGASYAGWNANPIAARETILAIHHPQGDLKKGSLGDVIGTNPAATTISGYSYPPDSMYMIDWYVGIVEHGSSGSAFFTFNPSRNALQLRGTLTGGNATCSGVYSRTYYQRLDRIYSHISGYLNVVTPAPAPATLTVVEYFHSTFGHYFITGSSAEIAALDSGQFAGWLRTGNTFRTFASGAPGAANVCRFFSATFAPRSSHFYTPFAAECAAVKENPSWQYEGDVFAMKAPTASGGCASGTMPVYRLYNNGRSGAPNHRYTTSVSIRSQMIGQGWIAEGMGTIGVIGCVPTS